MAIQLIYHSDDMGATPAITSRIIGAWLDGFIDSFSVLANGDALDQVKQALDSNPGGEARIVVHLNLCESRPILPVGEVPLLVDREGYFNVGFLGVLMRYVKGAADYRKALLDQVEREWRAQIEKVVDLVKPRKVSAVDGHIHMHMLPFFFPIAVKLAGEAGIPEIRMSREPFYLSRSPGSLSKTYLVNVVKHVVLKACAGPDLKCARRMGIGHPDAMIGILYTGMMNEPRVKDGIKAAGRTGVKRLEIAMHVGRATESELGRWQGNRAEAAFAMSPNRDIEFECLERLRGGR